MNVDTLIILAGVLLSAAANVGALWKMSLRWEHRLTHLEVMVEHMPKRREDYRESTAG